MVELDDLKGLFSPKWFYNSMILRSGSPIPTSAGGARPMPTANTVLCAPSFNSVTQSWRQTPLQWKGLLCLRWDRQSLPAPLMRADPAACMSHHLPPALRHRDTPRCQHGSVLSKWYRPRWNQQAGAGKMHLQVISNNHGLLGNCWLQQ